MSKNRCQNDEDRCEARLEALQAIFARIEGVFDDPALEAFGPLSTDTLTDVTEIVTRALVADEDSEKEPCAHCGLLSQVDEDGLCNACYDKHEQIMGGA